MAIAHIGTGEQANTDGGGVTLTLPTLSNGDIVIGYGGHGSSSATDAAISTGYTTITQGTWGDVTGTDDLISAYKFMGGTPDTTFTGEGGGNASDGVAYVASCFSGVDSGTPMDATATEASHASGSAPNSPAIVTVTDNARVLSGGAKINNDTSVTAPTGYGNQVDIAATDTNNISVGLSDKNVTPAGSENPAGWTNWSTTGGAMSISIALRPASGSSANINVPVGSLTLTGFAPTIVNPQGMTVPAGALTLTGFAPTVTVAQVIDVPAGALSLTGFAPSIANPQGMTVPAGSLTLTGFAPSIANPQGMDVPTGSLSLTGQVPTADISSGANINVPAGQLDLTGQAPTVATSDNKSVTPPAGDIILTGYAPDISGQETATPTGGKPYPLRHRPPQTIEEVFPNLPREEEGPNEQTRKRRKPAPVAPPDTSMADQLALVRSRLDAQALIQSELNAAQAKALAEENALQDEDALMIALALALWP